MIAAGGQEMKRIAACVFLFSLVTPLAFGQDEADRRDAPIRRRTGTILGMIFLPPGEHQVPEMITVRLLTLDGRFLHRKTLNQETSFMFPDVANGIYTISVESLGFKPAQNRVEVRGFIPGEQTFVTVKMGERLSDDDQVIPGTSGKAISVESLAIPEKALRELEKADRQSANNHPEKAIEHLERALEIYPDLYQAYNNLAVQYVRLGRKTEAIKALQKSIDLNPGDATAYRNLAQLHLSDGDYSEAISSLQSSLELMPENGKSLTLMGEAYLGIGQYQLALHYFQKVAQEDSQDDVHLRMGQCYLQLGRDAEALEEFKQFIARQPEDARAAEVRQLVAELERQLTP